MLPGIAPMGKRCSIRFTVTLTAISSDMEIRGRIGPGA